MSEPIAYPSRSFVIGLTAALWSARWAAATANALFDYGLSIASLHVTTEQAFGSCLGALMCLGMDRFLRGRALRVMRVDVAVLLLLSVAIAILWTLLARLVVAPSISAMIPPRSGLESDSTLTIAFMFLAWSLGWFSVAYAERLREAGSRADRAETRIIELEALLGQAGNSGIVHELWAPTRTGMTRLTAADIVSLAAEREYVRIHTVRGEDYLVRAALRSLHARLDPMLFVQTHRSTVVNVHHIDAIDRRTKRGLEIVMRDGRRLPVGRNHEIAVRGLIDGAAPSIRAGSGS